MPNGVSQIGITEQFEDTVGTTPVAYTGQLELREIAIRCKSGQESTKKLLFSLDATNFMTLSPGEAITWPVRGSIQDLTLKGAVADVAFELLINRS